MSKVNITIEMTEEEFDAYRKFLNTSIAEQRQQIIDEYGVEYFILSKGYTIAKRPSYTIDVASNITTIEKEFINSKENKKIYIVENIKN